jgi:hypothetical protein
MAKVFISYRRDDSQWPADRLYEALKSHIKNPDRDVFIDVDDIPLGVDFRTHLDSKVAQCEVLLALIGPRWLDARSDDGGTRRLDDPNDFVRIEIASALRRGVPVVPVLLDGTPIPQAETLPEDLKALSWRNGVEVRRLSFESDVQRLIRGLGLPGVSVGVSREDPDDLSKSVPQRPLRTALASAGVAAFTIFALNNYDISSGDLAGLSLMLGGGLFALVSVVTWLASRASWIQIALGAGIFILGLVLVALS